jgi:putative hydrolase of the HAD superfamily
VKLRAVSFDAAGTLFTVSEPVGTTYARFARRHGLQVAAERLEAGFHAVLRAAPPLAFPGASREAIGTLEREWWRRIVAETFAAAGAANLPPPLFEELFAHYASGGAWRCYDETLPVLTRLRTQQLRLAVISNFDSRLSQITASLGISAFLDVVVTSAGAGAAKPDPAIFQRALAALCEAPGEVVHVGDNRSADVAGALAAGLHAVLVDRTGPSLEPAPAGVPVIRSLAELEGALSHYPR